MKEMDRATSKRGTRASMSSSCAIWVHQCVQPGSLMEPRCTELFLEFHYIGIIIDHYGLAIIINSLINS